MKIEERVYKGFVFRKMYRQWINEDLGGFATWREAMEYINNLEARRASRIKNY